MGKKWTEGEKSLNRVRGGGGPSEKVDTDTRNPPGAEMKVSRTQKDTSLRTVLILFDISRWEFPSL